MDAHRCNLSPQTNRLIVLISNLYTYSSVYFNVGMCLVLFVCLVCCVAIETGDIVISKCLIKYTTDYTKRHCLGRYGYGSFQFNIRVLCASVVQTCGLYSYCRHVTKSNFNFEYG